MPSEAISTPATRRVDARARPGCTESAPRTRRASPARPSTWPAVARVPSPSTTRGMAGDLGRLVGGRGSAAASTSKKALDLSPRRPRRSERAARWSRLPRAAPRPVASIRSAATLGSSAPGLQELGGALEELRGAAGPSSPFQASFEDEARTSAKVTRYRFRRFVAVAAPSSAELERSGARIREVAALRQVSSSSRCWRTRNTHAIDSLRRRGPRPLQALRRRAARSLVGSGRRRAPCRCRGAGSRGRCTGRSSACLANQLGELGEAKSSYFPLARGGAAPPPGRWSARRP